MSEKLAMTEEEAAAVLSIPLYVFRGIAKRRNLRQIHIGGQKRYLRLDLVDLLNSLADEQASSSVSSTLDTPICSRAPGCNALGVRAINILENLGVMTIGDATGLTADDLVAVKGCGERTLREIRDYLQEHGVSLLGE